MEWAPIVIALIAALSTYAGGVVAGILRDKMHLILGFSAGAVIGVAFFDLLPEALELSSSASGAFGVSKFIAIGFLIYLVLDRVLALVTSHDHETDHAGHVHVSPKSGMFGALALSVHSLIDGVLLGIAFQASPAIGTAVAVAVLAHDFSDGVNTVSVVTRSGGDAKDARTWLAVDALAPVVGVLLTYFITPSTELLGTMLALCTGFFLYIGASDLIPESHHAHPKILTTFMTVLGCSLMYLLV